MYTKPGSSFILNIQTILWMHYWLKKAWLTTDVDGTDLTVKTATSKYDTVSE